MFDTHHTLPSFDKRIVLLHTDGPCAGMYEICGTMAEAVSNGIPIPPVYVPETHAAPRGTRRIACTMLRITPHMVLYTECPAIDPAQLQP